jgi:hypothetical protein
MCTRITDVYTSVRGHEFVFPEHKHVDSSKMAIAVSGGGTRTMTALLGQFRSLHCLNPDFYKRLSYLSGTSGGSWFGTIFVYSGVCVHELLGESVPLHSMNRETLTKTNFEGRYEFSDRMLHHRCGQSGFIGHVITDCPVWDAFLEGHNRVQPHKVYDYICGKVFLTKYGIQDRIPTLNAEYAELNKEYNHIDCIVPAPNMPFMITTAAIMSATADKGCILACEFTPMYSGIRTPTKCYGGLLFGNAGFGCDYRELNEHHHHSVEDFVLRQKYGNVTLETGMAASGAAYATEVFKKGSMMIGTILGEYNPRGHVWGMNSTCSHDVVFTDGGYFDYTGIIPLLARGCKRVLSFQNSDKFDGNYCNYGISHLFGVEQDLKCYGCEYRTKLKVFSLDDWRALRHDYDEKRRCGQVMYHRANMRVLRNEHAGVNGDYDVDIMFVPLCLCQEFLDACCVDITKPEWNDMRDFPNFHLFFENEGRLIGLYPAQVNLLSTFTDWCMKRIIELEPDFFRELEC